MSLPGQGDEIYLDGCGPYPVARPEHVEELCALVRETVARGEAVFPLGGGTLLEYGLPPSKPGWALALGRLNRVIDYPASDMTVTVEAGITVAQLQETLRRSGQWLPIDVPFPERASVGGALATNLPGPRRSAYGSWRDYVLGAAVVNDQGELTRSGGRVVKNVAGYDLHKLHIGALGTLGIIAQVTFKVRPLPERCVLMAWRCAEEMLPNVLDRLHDSQSRPATVAVLNGRAAQRGEWTKPLADPQAYCVLVGFEGKRTTVAWQVEQLQRELADRAGLEQLSQWEEESPAVWRWLADFPLLSPAKVSFRASVLPSQTAYLLKAAKHLGDPLVLAYAESGSVYGHWLEIEATALPEYLSALRATAAGPSHLPSEAAPAPGRVVVLRCPSSWKTPDLLWGQASADQFLHRKIKQTFDPQGCFNPGRFPAGW